MSGQMGVDILLVMPHPQPAARLLYRLSGILQPLGIGYVASYLVKNGYRVDILDNAISRFTVEEFKIYVLSKRPRYLGFSLATGCVSNAFSFASAAKEVNKDVTIIAGGPHASALPREVLRHGDIDIVVKGEGEVTVFELLRALDEKRDLRHIQGIVYRENGVIIENPDREAIRDLDSLPIPAYDLLPMGRYSLAPSRRFTNGKVGSIITTRGCPYRCTFCSRAVFGQTIRFRKPEAVIDEIKYLVRQFGIQELEIRDDTFTLDEDRAIEICRLMGKNNFNIIWNCCGRAAQTSDRLFEALYRAGCRALFIGGESGSQEILDLLKKDITVEQIEMAVAQCKKFKIRSLCSFVIGTPHERKDTLEQTLRFVKKIDPDFVSFCVFTPLPGSELFNDIVGTGLLNTSTVDWDRYLRLLLLPPPVRFKNFSGEELLRWQRRAIRQFYFRPKYIFGRIRKIKSFGDLLQMLTGLSIVIGHQLRNIKFSKADR